jgi:hypothetical protein
MSESAKFFNCSPGLQNFCKTKTKGCNCQAHKPEPNESVSPSRTSGSPTASRSDSVEAAASQLAPVLRPASGAASEGGCPYTATGNCDQPNPYDCRYYGTEKCHP